MPPTRFIPSLTTKDPNDNTKNITINKQTDIENELRNFYKDLYKTREGPTQQKINEFLETDNHPKIDQGDKQKMEGHLTMEEITTYIKQLKNNKSPGSTGFTGNFYNFFYNSIKKKDS